MKWIRKCPSFFLLIMSGILFTIVGIVGKNSIYDDYSFDIWKKPFLALAMEGIENGVYPWEAPVYKETAEAAYDTLGGEEKEIKEIKEVVAQVMGGLEKNENAVSSEQIEPVEESKEETLIPKNSLLNSEILQENNTQTAIVENESSKGSAADTLEGENNPSNQDTNVWDNTKEYGFTTVTEDYFNDAVFIGDSRTVGLFEYGGIEERADFCAKISLTIYNVFTTPLVKDEETGRKITAEEALMKKQYGKVYLMLGINELGTGTTETFMEEYKKVIARLEELQPNATIFVEGIMRVTGSKNEADPIFNNTNINEKNVEIAKLADNKRVFYIDVNEVICDEKGDLNSEYTGDEVHLKAQYYALWKQFLLEHGIVRVPSGN